MKRIFLVLSVVLVIISAATTTFAEDRKGGYIAIKPGAYIPKGDLDDMDFDSTFSGEVTVGTYYTPNLALEAGVGYFKTRASQSASGFREEDHIWVAPVTITFKGVVPLKGLELFAGVGGGVYFAHLDIDGHDANGSFSKDENGVAWGGHVVAGVNVDIAPKVFLGAEGKYVFTSKAEFSGTKVDLDGFILSGVLGYRF